MFTSISQPCCHSLAHYNNQIKLDWQLQKNLVALHSVETLSSFKFHHSTQHVDVVPFCFNHTDSDLKDSILTENGVKPSVGIRPFGPQNNLHTDCYSKNFLVQEFEFRRYFISVFFTSYLPAIVMVIIGCLSTFIDPNSSPARVGMGVTSFLTISTLIQGLKSALPKVNYLTGLDVYLWACFMFVGVCLVEYAYINYTTIVLPKMKRKNSSFMPRTQRDTVSTDCSLNKDLLDPVTEKKDYFLAISNHQEKTVDLSIDKQQPYDYQVSHQIDTKFRFWYILSFLIFNVAYWIYYGYVAQLEYR